MSDNAVDVKIRVQTADGIREFDSAAEAVATLGKESGLAGGQLKLFEAALGGSLKAGVSLREALKDIAASASTVGAEVAAAAAAIAAKFKDDVPEAFKKTAYNATEARLAMRGLGTDIGVQMPRFVSSFLLSIGGVGPVLAAAFAPIAVIGLLQTLTKIPGAIEDGISSLRGWGEEAKKAYGDALHAAQDYQAALDKQRYALMQLPSPGDTTLDRIRKQIAANTQQITDAQKDLDKAKDTVAAAKAVKEQMGAAKSSDFGAGADVAGAEYLSGYLASGKEREQADARIKLNEETIKKLTTQNVELATEAAKLEAERTVDVANENKKRQDVYNRTREVEITGEEQHTVALLEAEKKYTEGRRAQGEITAAEAAALEIKLTEMELEARRKAIQGKLDLLKEDPDTGPKRQALLNELQAAEDKSAAAIQQIRAKQTAEEDKELDKRVKIHIESLNAKLKAEQDAAAQQAKLRQKLLQDDARAQIESEAGDEQHQTKVIERARARADWEQRMGLLTASQREQIDRELDAKEEAMQRAAIERELALLDVFDTQYASKRQRLLNQLQAMDDQRAARAQRDAEKVAEVQLKPVQAVFGKINATLDSGLRGMIQGTQTFGQFFRQMTLGMLTDFTSVVLRMGVQWVEHQALKKAAALGFSGIMRALHIGDAAVSEATGATERTVEITGAAAVGAANAFASTAAIPIVGPALAPEAAAGAYASILAFAPLASAQGGWDMPNADSFAFLHKREMVLPAHLADAVRGMAGKDGGSQQHDHFHYHAAQGENPASIERNVAALQRLHKDGRLSFMKR